MGNKEDSFTIGFDNTEGDIPMMMVMRTHKGSFEIVRAFTGGEALRVYNLLTKGVYEND